MTTSTTLTIGEVANRAGVAHSALRFYEREGLIESTRSEGGQRRYHRDVLRRIVFIRAAQRVGLGLEEINEALASLPRARTPTAADWGRLFAPVALEARRPYRRARAPPRPVGLVHRLRMSLAPCLSALQSQRRCRSARSGSRVGCSASNGRSPDEVAEPPPDHARSDASVGGWNGETGPQRGGLERAERQVSSSVAAGAGVRAGSRWSAQRGGRPLHRGPRR